MSEHEKMRNSDMPLLDRVEIALGRVRMMLVGDIPNDATDPDVVLADCAERIRELEAEAVLRKVQVSALRLLEEVIDTKKMVDRLIEGQKREAHEGE